MLVYFNSENVVQYEMLFFNTETQEKESLPMNELIGKSISFEFTGNIYCKNCGTKTKTSFNQGFCYPCFKDAPERSEEHTSELQSRPHLVCRLLLEKKK